MFYSILSNESLWNKIPNWIVRSEISPTKFNRNKVYFYNKISWPFMKTDINTHWQLAVKNIATLRHIYTKTYSLKQIGKRIIRKLNLIIQVANRFVTQIISKSPLYAYKKHTISESFWDKRIFVHYLILNEHQGTRP